MTTWGERRPSMDFYQVLDGDGSAVGDVPDLPPEELRKLFRALLVTRAFEEKRTNLQRRGEISITSRSIGEEAVALGSAAALRPDDWLFVTYRQTAALMYWEAPLDRYFAFLMGAAPETVDRELPAEAPPDVNIAPMYAPLAVNVTNAVGSAMVDAIERRDTVSLAYIGEGSTSEGDFHEALNFAGVFDVPAVIICQNNQWATSVPAHKQTAADTFAQKAVAHGVPNERVDGNDALAVFEKTKEAVERARNGDGPTFIECVTYRMGDHNTSDEASVYRSGKEREFWAQRDPKDRLESYLLDEGILTEDDIERMEHTLKAEVEDAARRAAEISETDPQRMFDNHLHGESWRVRKQRAELERESNDQNPFSAAVVPDRDGTARRQSGTGASHRSEDTCRMNVVEAINDALRQELGRDDSVRLLGYDIGPMGGVFRATDSLYEEFGPERIIETPLSENAILGTAVGMAMRGERIVPEIQFMGFFYPAFGQFMYTLAKMYKRSGGAIEIPVTVRMPYGGGVEAAEYHSESTESFLIHTPGTRVVCPSTPSEAKGLLQASIRNPDPVVFLEPKRLYRKIDGPVPDGSYTVDIDNARLARNGSDVTVLTWGAMVPEVELAADGVGADVEIVDLRTLSPLDVETILESVERTGRCVVVHEARRTLGLGAELSALVNEHLVDRLLAPVQRVSGFDVHFPVHDIETEYLPDAERIEAAIDHVLAFDY